VDEVAHDEVAQDPADHWLWFVLLSTKVFVNTPFMLVNP
jgi:hypothetical protein